MTPSPTPTITPGGPTPTRVPNPFQNPDFEQGAVAWDEFSALGYPLILSNTGDPGVEFPARSGTWLAWLGGDNDELSILSQEVTVPAAAPFLTYYKAIVSSDDCGYDFGRVRVDGTEVDVFDLCFEQETDWAIDTVDLSAYAGQTVTIEFVAETDDIVVSNLFIDDVSFESTVEPTVGQPDAAQARTHHRPIQTKR